jgi:16S rRNA (cytosine1402-N4)-methyltransferase
LKDGELPGQMFSTDKEKRKYIHEPVMLQETLQFLKPAPGKIMIDATLGGGGHAEAILKKLLPGGKLIGIDCDRDALRAAGERLAAYQAAFQGVKANYSSLKEVLHELHLESVDGLLFDLGVSSFQLDCPERGFSYREDVLLDMRMDQNLTQNAADLLQKLSRQQLARIFWQFGEEKWARRIASFLVRYRLQEGAITRSGQLVDIIEAAVPVARRRRGHPAKRIFQALRIAVNQELANLENGLSDGCELLRPGGRIVVLSYHSLEDKIVKNFFKESARGCICPPRLPICSCGRNPTLKILTPKPLFPGEREKRRNARARSAILRAAEKLSLPK